MALSSSKKTDDASSSTEEGKSSRRWGFRIPLNLEGEVEGSSSSGVLENGLACCDKDCHQADLYDKASTFVPAHLRQSFQEDGFVVFPEPVVSKAACDALNRNLEEILRGRYSRGVAPDKAPRLFNNEYEGSAHIVPRVDLSKLSIEERKRIKTKTPHPQAVVGPIGFSGNHDNVRVIQVINCHKCSHAFRQLACSPVLGRVVAELAGWNEHGGARLAQDQVWAKPPGAAPLTFHRDSPYFMFAPDDVVTVWLALDDMVSEIGPLQYVKGSHLWGEGRVGSANQFFQSNGGIALLKSAAEREGVAAVFDDDTNSTIPDFDIVSMAGLRAGGISIHNGRTWHGSGKNCSRTRPRRGLGLHFIPANARFTEDAFMSRLWRPYVEDALARNEDPANVELPITDFPITWQPTEHDNADEKEVAKRSTTGNEKGCFVEDTSPLVLLG